MTVPVLLAMAADAYPDRIAIDGDQPLTFAKLKLAADRVSAVVRDPSVGSIAFLGLAGPVWPIVLFGCAGAGVTLTPLNYRQSGEQLAELISRLDRVLIVADDRLATTVAGFGRPVVTSSALLALATGSGDDGGLQGGPITGEIEPSRPAVVLFTSGTSARPKAVILRHEHLFSYTVQSVDFGAAEPAEGALVCVPPYHIAGVGTVLTNTYAGRRITFLPDFDPRAWLEQVRRHRITQAMVVPTMLARIIRELAGRLADVPTLRALAYGGASISPELLFEALQLFPKVLFTNAYGLTETSSTIAILGPDDHRAALANSDQHASQRLSSVGRAVPGVEIRIVRDGGGIAATGEIGQLEVRGPQVSGEYADLGTALSADGWFATRDLAFQDESGYLFICGRADDTIIRGGENIAPGEIESVIREHESVADVAVVGEPDIEWGERTVAHVVLRPGSTIEGAELREWVRARARSSRTPDLVIMRSALPYNEMGKLLRRELVTNHHTEDRQ